MPNTTGTFSATGPSVQEPTSLGSYASYAEAQRVVDQLADLSFEVEQTQIIGSNLRMVEQVTGRLTWPRVLLSGAAGGAWFGLFVGLLFSILSSARLLSALTWGLSWGMIFGVVFAATGYGLASGRRDFSSSSVTVPSHYEVLVTATYGDRARALLDGLGQ
jgi:hypothetical protein